MGCAHDVEFQPDAASQVRVCAVMIAACVGACLRACVRVSVRVSGPHPGGARAVSVYGCRCGGPVPAENSGELNPHGPPVPPPGPMSTPVAAGGVAASAAPLQSAGKAAAAGVPRGAKPVGALNFSMPVGEGTMAAGGADEFADCGDTGADYVSDVDAVIAAMAKEDAEARVAFDEELKKRDAEFATLLRGAYARAGEIFDGVDSCMDRDRPLARLRAGCIPPQSVGRSPKRPRSGDSGSMSSLEVSLGQQSPVKRLKR